jgi:hypothetical protein
VFVQPGVAAASKAMQVVIDAFAREPTLADQALRWQTRPANRR